MTTADHHFQKLAETPSDETPGNPAMVPNPQRDERPIEQDDRVRKEQCNLTGLETATLV